jgi:hypothetical protein
VIPYYVILDEARFFFSDDICAWLRKLRDECQKFLEARAESFVEGGTEPKEFWRQADRLVSLLNEMPSRFQTELEFRQLTGRAAAQRRLQSGTDDFVW